MFGYIVEDKDEKERSLDIGEIGSEVTIFHKLPLNLTFMLCSLADLARRVDAQLDTTAIALTHVVYCLKRTPQVMGRLRGKLDQVVSDAEGT